MRGSKRKEFKKVFTWISIFVFKLWTIVSSDGIDYTNLDGDLYEIIVPGNFGEVFVSQDDNAKAEQKPVKLTALKSGAEEEFSGNDSHDYSVAKTSLEDNASKDLKQKITQVAKNPLALVDMIKEKFRREKKLLPKFRSQKKVVRFRVNKNRGTKASLDDDYEDFSNTTLTDEFILDYANLPNLFDSTNDFQPSKKGLAHPNCSEAFQDYYDQTYSNRNNPDKPKRLRMVLAGNESATENWNIFFQTGPHGSSGYGKCFKPHPKDMKKRGRGPCAEAFVGKECPFYPEFPLMKTLYPACCDRTGCYCECIYYCTNRQTVYALLETHISSLEFDSCTNDVKTMDEGIQWKEEQCKLSNNSHSFKMKEKECAKTKKKVVCVRLGNCIKDVCKFCYRWECETQQLLKSTAEEEQFRKNRARSSNQKEVKTNTQRNLKRRKRGRKRKRKRVKKTRTKQRTGPAFRSSRNKKEKQIHGPGSIEQAIEDSRLTSSKIREQFYTDGPQENSTRKDSDISIVYL